MLPLKICVDTCISLRNKYEIQKEVILMCLAFDSWHSRSIRYWEERKMTLLATLSLQLAQSSLTWKRYLIFFQLLEVKLLNGVIQIS